MKNASGGGGTRSESSPTRPKADMLTSEGVSLSVPTSREAAS
jgi:hypothetical protein